MFWEGKKWDVNLRRLAELAEGLARAASAPELVRVLGASPLVRECFDGAALWQLSGAQPSVVRSPALDKFVTTIDIASFFPPGVTPAATEVRDAAWGPVGSAFLCPLVRDRKLVAVAGFFKKQPSRIGARGKALASAVAAQLITSLENINLRNDVTGQIGELRGQKEYIQEIVNSINSGIIVINKDGTVLTANPYGAANLKTTVAEMLRRNVDEVLPGLTAYVAQGVNEATFDLAGAPPVRLGFSVSPLVFSDDAAGSIILFRDLSDITELRKQSRRREYFAAVGETASVIAHEVRTPLFAISSIAQLMAAGLPREESQKLAASILTETERLARLVDGILHYGKPLELDIAETRLRDLLAEARDQVAASLSQSGCSLDVDADAGLSCGVDRDKMKQVLHNIIRNAIEAGSKRIAVGATSCGDRIEIAFRDDGKGIKQENLEKVYRPFYSTKRAGTGLGLAICKKIVEEHGGMISIRSEPGHGTEVVLALKSAG